MAALQFIRRVVLLHARADGLAEVCLIHQLALTTRARSGRGAAPTAQLAAASNWFAMTLHWPHRLSLIVATSGARQRAGWMLLLLVISVEQHHGAQGRLGRESPVPVGCGRHRGASLPVREVIARLVASHCAVGQAARRRRLLELLVAHVVRRQVMRPQARLVQMTEGIPGLMLAGQGAQVARMLRVLWARREQLARVGEPAAGGTATAAAVVLDSLLRRELFPLDLLQLGPLVLEPDLHNAHTQTGLLGQSFANFSARLLAQVEGVLERPPLTRRQDGPGPLGAPATIDAAGAGGWLLLVRLLTLGVARVGGGAVAG